MTSKIRELATKYGISGFITYNLISVVSVSGWLSAIHLGLDVDPLIKKIDDVKTYLGFEVTHNEPTDVVDSNATNWTKLGTTLLIAFAAHDMTFPLRIGLTAYLTPRLSRFIGDRGLSNIFKKRQ